MVLVDGRERTTGIPHRLAAAGLAIRIRALGCADYVVGGRLAIVRKSDSDLVPWQPLARFERGLREVAARYPAVVLLIERRPGTVSDEHRRSALTRAARHGITVLETGGRDDVAAWIVRFAEQERRAPTDGWGMDVPRKAAECDVATERLVATLPGVSWIGARRLLEHFGSVAAIASATPEELQRVRGFGPKRAASIAGVMRHRYGAAAVAGGVEDDRAGRFTRPAPSSPD